MQKQLTIEGEPEIVARDITDALKQIKREKPELFERNDKRNILIEYCEIFEGTTDLKHIKTPLGTILRGIRKLKTTN